MFIRKSSLIPPESYSPARAFVVSLVIVIPLSWLLLVAIEHIWPIVGQLVPNKKTVRDWNFSVADLVDLIKILIPVAIAFQAIYVRLAIPIDFFLFSSKDTELMQPVPLSEHETLTDEVQADLSRLLAWAMLYSDQKRWGNPWRRRHSGEADAFAKESSVRTNENYRRQLVIELANALENLHQQGVVKRDGWLHRKFASVCPSCLDAFRRASIWKRLKNRHVSWDVGMISTTGTDRIPILLAEWRPRLPSMLILNQPSPHNEKTIEDAIKKNTSLYRYPVRLLVMPRFQSDASPKPTFKIVRNKIDQVIDEITLVFSESDVRTIAIYGLPGIGKSTLARAIRNAISDPTRVRKLSDHFIDHPPFLCQLGKDADRQKVLRIFQDWAKSLGVSDDVIQEHSRGQFGTDEYRLNRMRDLVADALRGKKKLIVVDDVWRNEVASWLRLCVPDNDSDLGYIFTTRESGLAFQLAEKRIAMPLLTQRDTLEFFRENLPRLFESHDNKALIKKLESVATLLGGLPKSLELVAWSLRNLLTLGGTDEVEQFLEKLEHRKTRISTGAPDLEGHKLSLNDIIATSYDILDEEQKNDLVTLSALRPDPEVISTDLATELLGGLAKDKLDKLEETGLLKRIDDLKPRKVSENKNDVAMQVKRYSMHRSISDFLMEHKHNTAELKASAYEKAALFYEKLFDSLDQEHRQLDSDYHSWYRYENPPWLVALDNWRYYTMCQNEGYEKAAFKFTEEWFSAFWWWGTFTRSPFCDSLLANWPEVSDNASAATEDRRDLMAFEDAYPTETVEERSHPKAEWAKVQKSLESILERRGIDHKDIVCRKEQAYLYGLLKIFLAESHRFGDGNKEKTESDYRSAIILLERSSDERSSQWLCAWAHFHLGDFLHETGRDDDAMAILLNAVLPVAEQMRDHELWALVELDFGELAGKSDIHHAAKHYHSAVQLAYRFQIDAGGGPTVQPDEYTTKFYSKTIRRVARNLIASYELSKEGAISRCRELASRWKNEEIQANDFTELLANKDARALAIELFPAEFPEPVIDGTQIDTAYENYAQEVMAQLEPLTRQPASAGALNRA